MQRVKPMFSSMTKQGVFTLSADEGTTIQSNNWICQLTACKGDHIQKPVQLWLTTLKRTLSYHSGDWFAKAASVCALSSMFAFYVTINTGELRAFLKA
jgi:hypothetical protein